MANPINCWEFKSCGRGPGGTSVASLGVCPAATDVRMNGVNGGVNGGRACWALAGTLCGGIVQGTMAMKLGSCMRCEFYKKVIKDEGPQIASARMIHQLMR